MRAHTVSPCVLFLLVSLLLASAPPPSSALTVTLTVPLPTTPPSTESQSFSSTVPVTTCFNQATGMTVTCPSPAPLTTAVTCVDPTTSPLPTVVPNCPPLPSPPGNVIQIFSVKTITVDLVNATPPPTLPITFSTGLTINCSTCTDPVTLVPLNPQVIAKQSGGVQKLFASNLRITAPTTACTPCTLTIVAKESSLFDPLQSGPIPTGVFWSGVFNLTGTDPSVDPGDNISLAAVGNSEDVINAIPGGGAGDTPQSLPSSCSGLSTCMFAARQPGPSVSFTDSISETSQLTCTPSCSPSAKFTAIVNLGTPGDSLDLPASTGYQQVGGDTQAKKGAAAPLIAGLLTPFVFSPDTKLQIGSSTYDLKAPFTLNTANTGINPLTASTGINPLTDPVSLEIDIFQTFFRPGRFTLQGNGSFCFKGVIGGVTHDACFIPLDTLQPHQLWEFKDQAGPANNLPTAGTMVPLKLTVRDNFGRALVEAFQ